MTLRDIGHWISQTVDAFSRDLDIVLTASPLDWPLYMMVLALPAAALAFGLFGLILAFPVVLWEEFWSRHFDQESRPITPFGIAIDKGLDIFTQVGIFIIVWFVAFLVIGGGTMLFFEGNESEGLVQLWLVLLLPTIIAGGVSYLAYRGRKAKEKE